MLYQIVLGPQIQTFTSLMLPFIVTWRRASENLHCNPKIRTAFFKTLFKPAWTRGIELLKKYIYMIGSDVSAFESRQKMRNHSTLLNRFCIPWDSNHGHPRPLPTCVGESQTCCRIFYLVGPYKGRLGSTHSSPWGRVLREGSGWQQWPLGPIGSGPHQRCRLSRPCNPHTQMYCRTDNLISNT